MKVRVFFQDEGRFGRISDSRRCWGPLPKRPEVGQQVIREYVYSFAAVCPEDGQMAALIMPTVNSEIMSVFLEHTAQLFQGDYCLMFLDGAGWHRAQDIRIPNTISLIPLPPYSPELNPVEGIWKHLREMYFANRALNSLNEVEEILCDGLHNLINDPLVVKSITSYPWINTLSMTAN
jgi:transposase